VDGGERLYQEWFLVRQGASGPQASVNTLGAPLGVSLSSSNATMNYATPSFTVTVGFLLQGGTNGSGSSDLTETISIQNTTNNSFPMHLFQYSDFDLADSMGADTLSFPTSNSALQMGGSNVMTETVQSPPPSFWEGSFYALTLDKITGASAVTLSDSLIPPFAGDQTFAYQWDATVAPAQSLLVNLTQSIRRLTNSTQLVFYIDLNIAVTGDNIVLFWPSMGTDTFQLQSADDLAPDAIWSNVTNSRVPVGGNYQVTMPHAGGAKFYRLQR
jgi:hypothetical protein